MRPPLPATIRIGPFDYKVKPWDTLAADNAAAYGICDKGTLTILIKENLPPTREAEIVLHECLHAVCDAYGIGLLSDGEEPLVNGLGLALTSLLRDNPDLVAYLEGAFGRGPKEAPNTRRAR